MANQNGKLRVMRQGPDGPYYSLQCREGGKPVARYTRPPPLGFLLFP